MVLAILWVLMEDLAAFLSSFQALCFHDVWIDSGIWLDEHEWLWNAAFQLVGKLRLLFEVC